MKCPVCDKKFAVLWPNQWRYKRDNQFLCSYDCMRAIDKGENEMKKTITDEMKREAVRIALEGGEVCKYLRDCGSKNPSAHWTLIKKQLMKKDPETYEKLAKVDGRKKKPEKPAEAPTVKLDGPIRIETPEKNKVQVVETPEKQIGGLCPPPEETETSCRVTALDTPIGEFHYDRRHNFIDWDWDNNTMSLKVEEWKEFRKWFPYALERLGVKL